MAGKAVGRGAIVKPIVHIKRMTDRRSVRVTLDGTYWSGTERLDTIKAVLARVDLNDRDKQDIIADLIVNSLQVSIEYGNLEVRCGSLGTQSSC